MESMKLRVGEQVSLRLPGRGTAGYSWVWEAVGALEAVSISRSSVPPVASDDPRSGSADEVFLLRGSSVGQLELHFELRRTWDAQAAAIDTRYYVIDVVG